MVADAVRFRTLLAEGSGSPFVPKSGKGIAFCSCRGGGWKEPSPGVRLGLDTTRTQKSWLQRARNIDWSVVAAPESFPGGSANSALVECSLF